jgi:hypothetical protein
MKKVTGWPSWNATIISTCAMIRHTLNVRGSLRSTVAGVGWGKNSTASDVMKIVARRRKPRQSRLSARLGTEGKRVGFRRRVWEPCCGAGAISAVLALALTATVHGQLALLVRLEWIAGKRVAEVMTAAPVALMIILTRHIPWSDMGARTNASQHHHALVAFDRSHLPRKPPALLYA